MLKVCHIGVRGMTPRLPSNQQLRMRSVGIRRERDDAT